MVSPPMPGQAGVVCVFGAPAHAVYRSITVSVMVLIPSSLAASSVLSS